MKKNLKTLVKQYELIRFNNLIIPQHYKFYLSFKGEPQYRETRHSNNPEFLCP